MACFFRKAWMENSNFSWIREVSENPKMAFCALCKIKFSLSNMGLTAVKSHRSGKKHQQREKDSASSVSLPNVLLMSKKTIPKEKAANIEPRTSSDLTAFHRSDNIEKFFLKDNVYKSEILWCIETVMTHKSLRSAEKDSRIFHKLFPDSEIAKGMQLGKDKISYILVYGLLPHFKASLIQELISCSHFVIGFDESINKVSQRQQMDVNIRYWCSKKNEVQTRYLNSAFLGRTRATDLVNSFNEATQPLNLKRLLQISMDGPNVNKKFFKELSCSLKESSEDPEVLNIGSCGLHALNVAFKTGMCASDWKIMEFHRDLYYLFKDSPARRALFTQYTNSELFPRKFCFVRWIENSSVAERSLQLLPLLKVFVEKVEEDKVTPKSRSYKAVKCALSDHLLPAKIAFFQSVASDFETFLREYQTDVPLIPFLYNDLCNFSLKLMQRFIKKDALRKNDTNVDVEDETNFLPVKQIDVGLLAQSHLKKKKVSDLQIFEFKTESRNMLIKCLKKVQEKSPLIYKLTKAVSCFDPKVAVNEYSYSIRLSTLLLILSEKNWISGTSAEKSKVQLKEICSRPQNLLKLNSYKRSAQRIDSFWYDLLSAEENTVEAMTVLKIVMVLSHGNASLERGFSINKDCLEQNMREETIIARRVIYDYVSSNGGMDNIEITKQMILSVKNARSKYTEALEKRKKEDQEKVIAIKRKREAKIELKRLNEKKIKILEEAQKESQKIENEIAAIKSVQNKI